MFVEFRDKSEFWLFKLKIIKIFSPCPIPAVVDFSFETPSR